jgi:hypothetical protein
MMRLKKLYKVTPNIADLKKLDPESLLIPPIQKKAAS